MHELQLAEERAKADRSRRGSFSRAKGVRFERKLARLFRAEGLLCRRVLEYNQGLGRDLEVGLILRPFTPEHPQVEFWDPKIAIQAKATKDASDLRRGFDEVVSHNPHASLWVCLHSHNRKLSILLATPSLPLRLVSWSEMVSLIRQSLPLKPYSQGRLD